MMFANIFYFFSAIIIISFAPEKPGSIGFPLNIVWIFVFLAFFIIYNKKSFNKLRDKYNKQEGLGKNTFNKVINSNMVLALFFFTISILFFDIKLMFTKIPLIGGFGGLIDVLLLLFFVFYLSIVWYWSFKYFKDIYSLGNSTKYHLISNIKFNIAIIIPWFVFIIFENLFSYINIPIIDKISESAFAYPLQMFAFIIILFIFTPFLITKLWESEPLEEGDLDNSIRAYCKQQNVKFKGILSWNALNKGLITAAVMGIIYPFRYLLLTPKLMNLLTKEEILAVVSHEVGHVKKKHMFFYLAFFFSSMPLLTAFATYLVQLFQITEPGRSIFIYFYEPSNLFLNILIIVLTLFFFIIFFRFVFAYFMRNFERQADIYCFESGVDPEYLISSFEKLNTIINEPKDKNNWHHFNIFERVAFLKKCQLDPLEIKKHNKKVKKSLFIIGIAILLTLIISFGFVFSNNLMTEKVTLGLQIDIYKKMIKNTPNDYRLFREYAMLNYVAENWEQAVFGFNKSLNLKINQPEVLNNFAWLQLTCKDKKYLNKTEALRYSEMAWAMVKDYEKKSEIVFILDTLAEAYYQNGLFNKAFTASKQARSFANDNKEHYDNQYNKMKKAKMKNTVFTDTI